MAKELEKRYLERLSELYENIGSASTEIINMSAILNLPKGTEHFLTDIHGENEAFTHMMKNGSGAVRSKIEDAFGTILPEKDKRFLATLIYYPEEKMLQQEIKNMGDLSAEWYQITLSRLIEVAKCAASKYTRSKVRKALPRDFAYVLEELLTENSGISDKENYYPSIIQTIVQIRRGKPFIVALCELIQRLVVDHLHIVGDIFDRGPGPHLVMDQLMNYHSVDIQWGNHDILWMGAAAGQHACIANVIRNCARYGNMDILEDAYGINFLPLANFASTTYADDPCTFFNLKAEDVGDGYINERELDIQMHKAISVIQFKLEGQLAINNPCFGFQKRNLLHCINYEDKTITIEGEIYPIQDCNFPTVDKQNPYALSKEEEVVMQRLEHAFLSCAKLQSHMRFLLNKGSLYKCFNGNLLYHGCVPLTSDGEFKEVDLFGTKYKGKALYDALDQYVRQGFFSVDREEKERGKDVMLWIWQGKDSPLFGKDKMATFERYFVADQRTYAEKKNPYYEYIENPEVVDKILLEFGMSVEESHIVNGHVPVKVKEGESPIKCHGKVVVIDGGLSRAYQEETGIAGYTLIYNSHGLILAAHESFTSTEDAIEREIDIHSHGQVVQRAMDRVLVRDTDSGKEIQERIEDLEQLLKAYRLGTIVEKG